MVAPAQVPIIAGLPRAAALALVQAAQVPTQVGDSDDTVRHKLTIAVWAAETLRSPLDFRSGLRTSVRTPALDYLGVDATWAEPLQDAFLTSALTRCQRAPWSLDPGQSQGLLSGARVACLVLIGGLRRQPGGGHLGPDIGLIARQATCEQCTQDFFGLRWNTSRPSCTTTSWKSLRQIGLRH